MKRIKQAPNEPLCLGCYYQNDDENIGCNASNSVGPCQDNEGNNYIFVLDNQNQADLLKRLCHNETEMLRAIETYGAEFRRIIEKFETNLQEDFK